jgi:hypothetical protein
MEALNWFIDGTSVSGLAVYCAGISAWHLTGPFWTDHPYGLQSPSIPPRPIG